MTLYPDTNFSKENILLGTYINYNLIQPIPTTVSDCILFKSMELYDLYYNQPIYSINQYNIPHNISVTYTYL